LTNTENSNALKRRFKEIEMTRENAMMTNAIKFKVAKLEKVRKVGRHIDEPTNKRNRNAQETILVDEGERERAQTDGRYGKEPNMEAQDEPVAGRGEWLKHPGEAVKGYEDWDEFMRVWELESTKHQSP
jgi:hypothetical protein